MAAEIAWHLGVSKSAVSKWRTVPLLRVRDVAAITGIPLYLLRPDFFPPPRRRAR